ncbi:MAG TPA: alpha amylase C-terminal domain-containing protein, partial [Polyangiaceae bacterium]|nr:alpha amylase C-terminal domain-containing protein [Polyangiaceae bacterium]
DWAIGNHPAHSGIGRWLGDLNAAYKKLPALHVGDCEASGFQWIIGNDADASILAYARLGDPNDAPVVVAANFTPIPREGYRIGVPRGGFWREVLNSDAEVYGGAGMGNSGGMHAEKAGAHGREHSLVITVPPLAVVVFSPEA